MAELTPEKEGFHLKRPKKNHFLNKGIDLLSSIFLPVVNIMLAAGLLKGTLAICSYFQLFDETSSTYLVFSAISDTFFYFLPVFLAYSAAQKFKMNSFTAVAVACVLLHPTISDMLSITGNTFFGLPITSMEYSSTVIPVLLSVYLAKWIEVFFHKILPEMIRNIFTPLFCILIAVPATLILFGPIGITVGVWISDGFQLLYQLSPAIAGFAIGFSFQLMVIFGAHWALIPIMINNLALNHFDVISAMCTPSGFCIVGATIAVALRSKSKKMKSTAASAAVSGFFGITEPALYSVCLFLKRPMICACSVAGICGAFSGVFGCRAIGFSPGGITSLPVYWGGAFIPFVCICAGGLLLSAVITYAVGFSDPTDQDLSPS